MEGACPACGGALAPWRDVRGGEPSDTRRYPLLRCESCGSAVTDSEPPPPEVYETGQYKQAPPRLPGPVSRFQRLVGRQPVRFLKQAGVREGARVLDVGAGPGRLVQLLGEGGFDAFGIDPSRRSTAIAHQLGRKVERRDLYDYTAADLDAAVMWHVLEHLDDPPSALATVHAWLRPGGLMLVGVPNVASLQAAIGGESWFHLDVPRHRVHFTADGLDRLLARTGFEVLRAHHFIHEQNVQGMWMALLMRLGMRPGFPFHFVKRNIDARASDLALTAVGIPLIPLAALLEGGAAVARRGGTIAVVARAA